MLPANFRTYPRLPDIQSGFEIYKNAFSLVIPEGKTNYVTNPSGEIDITGYSALNSTIVSSTTRARRGVRSIRVTPSSISVAAIVFYSVVAPSSGVFAFSFDISGKSGQKYQAYIADNIGNPLQGIRRFGYNGFWKREYTVSANLVSGTTYRLYVVRTGNGGFGVVNTATLDPFYVDGFQFEAGDHPTTYIDGDQMGYVSTQSDYWWNGIPHASTSGRSQFSRAGGQEMNLSKFMAIMALVGLGASPVSNIKTPAVLGGSFYQNTMDPEQKEFTIAGAIMGTGFDNLSSKISDLWNIVNPFLNSPKQSILLKYRPVDDCGVPTGETWNIPCYYNGGLETGPQNGYQSRVALNFVQYFPLIERESGSGVISSIPEIINQNTATNSVWSLKKDPVTGRWSQIYDFYAGFGGGGSNIYLRLLTSRGDYYLTSNSGATKKWNGSALSNVGLSSGLIGMMEARDGRILAWSNVAGHYLDAVNPVTLAITANVGSFDGTVRSMSYSPDLDRYYVGGDFSNSGITGLGRIGFTSNLVTFSAIGYPGANVSFVCAYKKDVYVGLTTGEIKASYYSNAGVWVTVYTPPATSTILDMNLGPDGLIYWAEKVTASGQGFLKTYNPSGGLVTTIVTMNMIYWDGTVPVVSPGSQPYILKFTWDSSGTLYFTYIFAGGAIGPYWIYINGQVAPTCPFAMYNNGVVSFPDINNSGRVNNYDLALFPLFPADGSIQAFGESQITSTDTSFVNTKVTNPGPSNTGMTIKIYGANGPIYSIRNETSKQSIILNSLIVNPNEIITIITGKYSSSINSNVRGDMSAYLLPGSDLGMVLYPGDNYISMGNMFLNVPINTNPSSGQSIEVITKYLSGLDLTNTDNYALYVKVTFATKVVNFYKDSAMTQLVAHVVNPLYPAIPIIADNSSGISGNVIVDLSSIVSDQNYILYTLGPTKIIFNEIVENLAGAE